MVVWYVSIFVKAYIRQIIYNFGGATVNRFCTGFQGDHSLFAVAVDPR